MADSVPGKPVSAAEVNRFCYCPWQWYYERVYGTAELRRLQKERNEAMGYTPSSDPADNPFVRGRAFHENYAGRYHARRRRRLAAAILVLAAVLCGLIWAWLRYA